jgi:hypothetical protein
LDHAIRPKFPAAGSGKIGPGIGFMPAGGPTAEALSLSSLPDHSAHRLDRRKIDAWERNGCDVPDVTGPAFAKMVSAEVERWRKVVTEANVKLD